MLQYVPLLLLIFLLNFCSFFWSSCSSLNTFLFISFFFLCCDDYGRNGFFYPQKDKIVLFLSSWQVQNEFSVITENLEAIVFSCQKSTEAIGFCQFRRYLLFQNKELNTNLNLLSTHIRKPPNFYEKNFFCFDFLCMKNKILFRTNTCKYSQL